MAKYILKQAAIFALTNEANTHSNPVKRAYTRAAAIIEQITAEDVQPVKHGYWIKKTSCTEDWFNMYLCSECGKSHFYKTMYKSMYCPDCGARMDKEN